jgi:hypothetical protein
MISLEKSSTKKPLLNQNQTKYFVDQIDKACLEIDFIQLIEVVNRFNLENHTEYLEFCKQGKIIFDSLNCLENDIRPISISPFSGRCIFCNLGKTVKGYKVEFSKKQDNINIIFTNTFAINLEIENELLVDFSWCNAFVNREET